MSRSTRLIGAAIAAACTAVPLAAAQPAAAANAWTTTVPVSATSGSTSYPSLVAGPNGTATAIWIQTTGSASEVQVAQRAANGTWGAPKRLSDPAWLIASSRSYAPQLTIEPSGAVDAVWAETASGSTEFRVRTARAAAGAAWTTPQTVGSSSASFEGFSYPLPISPTIAADVQGRVAAGWIDNGTAVSTVRASAAGAWSAPTELPEPYPSSDDDWYYGFQSHDVGSIRLTVCGGRIRAVWSDRQRYQNYNSHYDARSWEPPYVFTKDLGTNGQWPARDVPAEPTRIASGSGVGSVACAPSGEQSIDAVGDYGQKHAEPFEPDVVDVRATSVTKPAGGTWGAATTYSGTIPKIQQTAYAADGGLLRITELNRQVFLAVKPKGGTFGAATPLLPAAQPTTNPSLYVGPNGAQTLLYARDGDVASHAEVRQRPSTGGAWSSPVTLSTAGSAVGNLLAAGNADGTLTALVLQKVGANWRLTSSSYIPTPTPSRVPAKLSGATITFDLDLARTAAACPAASALWVTPKNSTGTLAIKSRALAIKAGAGSTCTITGTVTLSAAPSRTGLTVSIGGTGLTYRTVVPS